jgi:hypothetical protein
MVIEYNYDDFDPDKIGGQFDTVAPGRYHVMVAALAEEGGYDNASMVVDFDILAGTTPNQEGKQHREYIDRTSKPGTSKAMSFYCAVGITTVAELKKLIEEKRNPAFDPMLAVGRQLCIEIQKEEWTDKKSGEPKSANKIGFRYFGIDSPKAAGIPISQAAAAKSGDSPDPFGGGSSAGEGGGGGDDDIFG